MFVVLCLIWLFIQNIVVIHSVICFSFKLCPSSTNSLHIHS